jgi:hypothetical protein
LGPLAGRPLLVLGMHRSGTSSFVGLAARLGAALGSDLLEANEFNPRGYGEHRRVVEIHDRFLGSQGLAWDSPRRPAGFEGAAADEARGALRELLLREFAAAPLFAVKDPRLCRLLPLWQPVLASLEVRPAWVLLLRHPLEIAASLERRDGLTKTRSLLLFVEHLLAAERGTRGAARSLVPYEALFSDWRGVAKRVAAECDLEWPRDPESAAGEIEGFLSGDLRHHRAAEWPADEVARFRWAVRLHEELGGLARREGMAEREESLDRLAATLDEAAALYEPELAAAEGRLRDEAALRREAEKRARRAERKRAELADRPGLWLRSYLRRRLGKTDAGPADGERER